MINLIVEKFECLGTKNAGHQRTSGKISDMVLDSLKRIYLDLTVLTFTEPTLFGNHFSHITTIGLTI